MKRLLVFVCTISLIIGTYSCSNDFELADKWKDIPVVYGLLSMQDTAHYIRVEKAFLDDEVSAFDVAQIVDSLYYEDAAVTLIRTSDDTRYPMTKVDGSLEGYSRDEGIFANVPNYLYKFKGTGGDTLVAGAVYELEINRGDDLPLVTGRTVIVDHIDLTLPDVGQSLELEFEKKTTIRWRSERSNAIFFDLFIDFYYTEIIGGEEELKSFRWLVKSNFNNEETSSNILTYKFDNESLYIAIQNNISESTGEVREFEYMEFGVKAGGQEIYDYIQINQINTGITGSQLLPNFTNMSEGYGIFSSTNETKNTVFLDLATLDSLENGIYTKNLNFQ